MNFAFLADTTNTKLQLIPQAYFRKIAELFDWYSTTTMTFDIFR